MNVDNINKERKLVQKEISEKEYLCEKIRYSKDFLKNGFKNVLKRVLAFLGILGITYFITINFFSIPVKALGYENTIIYLKQLLLYLGGVISFGVIATEGRKYKREAKRHKEFVNEHNLEKEEGRVEELKSLISKYDLLLEKVVKRGDNRQDDSNSFDGRQVESLEVIDGNKEVDRVEVVVEEPGLSRKLSNNKNRS